MQKGAYLLPVLNLKNNICSAKLILNTTILGYSMAEKRRDLQIEYYIQLSDG